MNKKVTIITVDYKNAYHTQRFVKSLSELTGFSECQIAIVGNESDDETREKLEQLRKKYSENVTIFYVMENLYYWGGAAFGINKLYPDRSHMPDWLIVCNNDILIEQKEFLTKLSSLNYEEYGVIAPSIISSITQKDQNPFRISPINKSDLVKWKILHTHYALFVAFIFIGRLLRKVKVLSRYKRKKDNINREKEIYAPHGSFVIFSKRFFEKGGNLDTNFTLYGEENTTAEITKNIGLTVRYCPSLQVIHNEHSTTGHVISKVMYEHGRKSHQYFCERYLKGK